MKEKRLAIFLLDYHNEHQHMMQSGFLKISCPVNIYLFKVNNHNTRKRREICFKLTIKTPEESQCHTHPAYMKPCTVIP